MELDEIQGGKPGGEPGLGRWTVSDATLVDSPIGLDTTIASTATPAGSAAAATLDTRPPGSTTLVRSTVLPRLEMVGTTPRLVTQGKPRYEHTRRLGEGGLGEVLGARDNDIDRDVAVKRLRPDVASPATLARFVEEVRTIGRLEHPNIVPIHDVGVDEKRRVLLRDEVRGRRDARVDHREARRGRRRSTTRTTASSGASRSSPRSSTRSPSRTRRGSFTATSSRRTSWWGRTARSS